MKLVHPLLSRPIQFRENCIPVLVMENPVVFRRLVTELAGQSEGKAGEFVLSVRDKPLDCAGHLNVFMDYVHLSEIEKRVQTRALNAFLRTVQETMAQETYQLSLAVQEYLGRLATLAEYPVTYEQSENLAALLKAMEFRIDLEGLTACEALYEQLALLHRLGRDQCLVLINAHAFFGAEELSKLYSMAQYQKMNLMLLESRAALRPMPPEDVMLFDEDLCELSLDLQEEML